MAVLMRVSGWDKGVVEVLVVVVVEEQVGAQRNVFKVKTVG